MCEQGLHEYLTVKEAHADRTYSQCPTVSGELWIELWHNIRHVQNQNNCLQIPHNE
ncbi:hypothetical protein PISMIDRAFT_181169 [Pisolithus microcarpus 441]|uniref:Unplaced genomic scaffold scaffold_117, whole genome shotgun sequence n=1 Tax=Pisolithus microcarpus 441 TaxID=765257 RepID=A0A0C9YXI8_9AGAM|nr:hypothetical protein PISMIDRAFT_181169 [Pisolithus microcarpus 441]